MYCNFMGPPLLQEHAMIQYDPNYAPRYAQGEARIDECSTCGTYVEGSEEQYSDDSSDDEGEIERMYGKSEFEFQYEDHG